MPRRARYLVPRGLPRRDEILAVCVVLAIGAHVLFAQLTIVFAVRVPPDHQGRPGGACRGWPSRRRPAWPGPRPARGPRWPATPPEPPGWPATWVTAVTRPITCCTSPPPSRASGPGCPGSCRSPCGRRGRRGRPGRLAELAAHRRVGPAPGPAGPDRGGQAGGHDPRDPGRRRGRQGRRLPGGSGRIGRPDHAVLGRGGRERVGLRLGRIRRADDRLPARPRRGPAAQAGARRRPHGRPGAGRPAGGGLRRGRACRCWCSAPAQSCPDGPGLPGWRRAGRARAACYEPFRHGLAGPAGRADHGHAQLGRPGPPVPAQLPVLPRRRLRAARRRPRRPARPGARRRHPPAQPRGHASQDGVRARRLSPAGRAGRAGPGIGSA